VLSKHANDRTGVEQNQMDTNADGTLDRQEFVMRFPRVCEEVRAGEWFHRYSSYVPRTLFRAQHSCVELN